MIAEVVPVLRVRRDTATWSYHLPPRTHCTVGSLVVIPFRGKNCLGVVWHLSEGTGKARESISRVLTAQPLVRAPQRKCVETLSQIGLCSLSTALYTWLPRGLRNLPLSRAAQQLVSEHSTWHGDAKLMAERKQHAIIVAGQRPEQTAQLSQRFGNKMATLFSQETSQDQELKNWFGIAHGEISIGIGREGALFAPWLNLRHLTIIEPEDVFYYHEQIPYLNLLLTAKALAQSFNSQVIYKSYLPTPVARLLWEEVQGSDFLPPSLELIDLHKEKVLNPRLLELISSCLDQDKKVLILYNAHDRVRQVEKEGEKVRVLIPGLETLGKRLASALGKATLPENIIIGTRSIFHATYKNVGLTIALTLDSVLDENISANLLHAWADLGHLMAYAAPCVIQTHNPSHPLINALLANQGSIYMLENIQKNKELCLPPFGQQIVCSYPGEEIELVTALRQQLLPLLEADWELSHPFKAPWHKKEYFHLMLRTSFPETRLSTAIRRILVALPRPWKVQHNPWYLF